MKNKTFKIRPLSLALLLAGIGMTHASSATDLMAVEGTWNGIPMWGFAADAGTCPGTPVSWDVGPQLTGADLVAGNLTINLRNCLSEPVSIIIPGQPATFTPQTISFTDSAGRNSTRIRAFTNEAAVGGTATYTWTAVKPGTYLYQSGSHPAKQVQMGLYGALTVGTYAGTSGDVTLLYSEIDPVLHSTAKAATPLDYHPRHFLVNGSESQSGITAGDTNQPTVLRMLNAGLDFHVPTLTGGYLTQVAEDGNAYPFAKQQYSVNLPAGKTIDALWQPASAGDHVIYDRRGPGMVASLTATAGVGAPDAADDNYAVDEDGSLSAIALDLTFPGVLDNDPGPGTLSANLSSSTSSGSLIFTANGSFTYTPDTDFNGTDSFTYKANDGTLDSNVATVNITVNPINDAPVANANAYDVVEGTILNVAAPGVMDNDTDIDSTGLTVTTVSAPTSGVLLLNADGSFDYTPSIAAPGADSFVYEVCDAGPLCATATVSLNIISQPNSAPVALDDTATVFRNSLATFINITDNDTDADGNLKTGGTVPAGQITITTGTTTTRGGSVTVLTNGVNYTPKRNFRGTDTFNYTVTDLDGVVSNEATVRVNVVRP